MPRAIEKATPPIVDCNLVFESCVSIVVGVPFHLCIMKPNMDGTTDRKTVVFSHALVAMQLAVHGTRGPYEYKSHKVVHGRDA